MGISAEALGRLHAKLLCPAMPAVLAGVIAYLIARVPQDVHPADELDEEVGRLARLRRVRWIAVGVGIGVYLLVVAALAVVWGSVE